MIFVKETCNSIGWYIFGVSKISKVQISPSYYKYQNYQKEIKKELKISIE